MKKLILLNLPLCAMVTLLFAWTTTIPGYPPTLTPAPTADICSENPAYAEAIIAQQWLEANPPEVMSWIYGDHAYMDSLYQQLLAEGKVQPPPPACTVTARADTPIFSEMDPTRQIGILRAGQSALIFGRDESVTWWFIYDPVVGYGWISGNQVDIQPGTNIDQVLVSTR